MKTIRSRQNELVATFRAAARTGRVSREYLLLDGARLIQDAHAAGLPIDAALFSTNALRKSGGVLTALEATLRAAGVETVAGTDAVLRAASPVRTPSGVVAVARHRPLSLRRFVTGVRSGLVVAAVGVQDPGNVGAIIRAADAGGARGVVVTRTSADPFGWRALRGAMGSTFRIPVATVGELGPLVTKARAGGARVVAAVPQGGRSVYASDLGGPRLLLVGTEGTGLDEDARATADLTVSVPMRRGIDSLNVAVATALIVYEARRQQNANRTGKAS